MTKAKKSSLTLLCLIVVTAILLMFASTTAHAGKKKSTAKKAAKPHTSIKHPKKDPLTLHDYIQMHCKKSSCVDQESILKSVYGASRATGADFKMLLSIAMVESKYDTLAKNGKSVGLMQVHLRWHRQKFQNKDVFAVDENVRVGAGIYQACWVKFKDRTKALRCYNGYPYGDPRYVEKVTTAYTSVSRLIDLQRDY